MNKFEAISTIWFYDERGKPKTNIPVCYSENGAVLFSANTNHVPLTGKARKAHLAAIETIRRPEFKVVRDEAKRVRKAERRARAAILAAKQSKVG